MFLLHLAYSFALLFLCFCSRECSALGNVVIKVPEVAKSGDTVTLSCEYDLEDDTLYSVKWYWNDEEFYRYVPKESPAFIAFNVQYINVDIPRSSRTTVTLRGVRRERSGNYKCEVSADAPLFHTVIRSAHMLVAELPSGNPVMNIEPSKVEIGKKIKADCYSPGSDPPANLTWYINDEKVTGNTESIDYFHPEIQTDKALGLHSSRARLVVTTNRLHFQKGIMKLSCEATVYSLWRENVDGYVKDDTPELAPVLGSTSSHSQGEDIRDVPLKSSVSWLQQHHSRYFVIVNIIILCMSR